MNPTTSLQPDGFHIAAYNSARAFSSFLPGIAGAFGKPMWAFYTNRGQCLSSFGVGDKNGAMLEFHPANKAYTLTPLLGFRSFLRVRIPSGTAVHEPFLPTPGPGVHQHMTIRPEELEIEETHAGLGLRIRVVYFTLPNENLPALVRHVTVENTGPLPITFDALDGLPQVVPFGLEEKLLKHMSRTMEAFAEIRNVGDRLPFYKLKVEPSDKPDVTWIDGGFFAFTLHQNTSAPIVADPDQVFGSDTSLRTPLAFVDGLPIDPVQGRSDTLTGCAFAQLSATLAPGESTSWQSYFGHVPDWSLAQALRQRVLGDAHYSARRRGENSRIVADIGERFAVCAGPAQLSRYTQQAFLDNTLRGGQPVMVDGPRGPRVFHTFTRKHGDMERDYNFFEVAPTYWSQGNGNFRDVNQNRRSENFTYPAIDASNIETFFNLVQIDGNNPLVVRAEKFCLTEEHIRILMHDWHAGNTPRWQAFLAQPFSPGLLLEQLIGEYATPEMAQPWFDRIIGLSDKVQGAEHGEGYWVDHWIYNLDLLDSYTALYPDRLRALLVERRDFTYFDNPHVVQPRAAKTRLRKDGSVRQLHAVVRDSAKAAMVARRVREPELMRDGQGHGAVYRTTLLAKIFSLLAVKATLFDPSGLGLEMEAEKPGWCDALNGLPGLFGSSTHEAYALQRWAAFARGAVRDHLGMASSLSLPVEVAGLLRDVTSALESANPVAFFPTWDALASRREVFRDDVRMGVLGTEDAMPASTLLQFLDAVEVTLARGLATAIDSAGLPVSYFVHEACEFDRLAPSAAPPHGVDTSDAVYVRVRRFEARPISAFLEGTVHALRSAGDSRTAAALYAAVRESALFDRKLGMYRVNTPLDSESFEIGRSRIFSPGWLENESVFLHMHYKFLLETLRSGLAREFYEDLRRGLVAFHDPAIYGRSPLENSSFIASSRFPDPKVHGVGFVARLSGATAEWISMVLHMALGATPFRLLEGQLRFQPRPTLAGWLFTDPEPGACGSNCFGIKLFGTTWVTYLNPSRHDTFGTDAVAVRSFQLEYADGTTFDHAGEWLPDGPAGDLRDGKVTRVLITLG